jgi:hypothetical protein
LFRRWKGDAIGSQDFDLLLMIRHGLAKACGREAKEPEGDRRLPPSSGFAVCNSLLLLHIPESFEQRCCSRIAAYSLLVYASRRVECAESNTISPGKIKTEDSALA